MTDEITTYEEEVWLPEYVYVLQQKEAGNTNYTPYGFDQLEVPSDCTTVEGRMAWLTTRFNERYYYRRLNAETMDRWQILLQDKFDAVVRRYERAYKLYTTNADAMETVVSTQNTDVTHKTIDTPDEQINDASDYASSVETSSVKATSANPDTVKGANTNIDAFRDIDTQFIKEFENNFLNVFWY